MDIQTVDEVLTTTRSVRKRLDLTRPVDASIIQTCLEIAVQAPTGGNLARYHFLVITDPTLRADLAAIYRKAYHEQWGPGTRTAGSKIRPQDRVSFDHLAEHLHEVPVHVIACVERARVMGGRSPSGTELASILPATWSLMLALRAREIGSALTTIHALYEEEAAELLGIPAHVRQAALLPVAHFTGEGFRPAHRTPARERTYWNRWGQAS